MGRIFLLHIPVVASLSAGLGVQYVHSSGFTLGLKAGGAGYFLDSVGDGGSNVFDKKAFVGEGNLLLGYRY